MKEYNKVEPEVIVGLGDNTEFLEKKPPFRTVTHLHIDLEDWLGDDLMECHPCYIVTEQLKKALEKTRYTGFEFAEMEVSKNKYFKNNYRLNKPVPNFYWMKIIGEENKDDFYMSSESVLMCNSEVVEFISKNFTHKYMDVDLEQDPEDKDFLNKLLERAKQRNSSSE